MLKKKNKNAWGSRVQVLYTISTAALPASVHSYVIP
jgi:hypothetical protein